MEELRDFRDITIIQQTSKKTKKLKGKGRKDKETETESSSQKSPPPAAKNPKEFLLSNEELDDLTNIKWVQGKNKILL